MRLFYTFILIISSVFIVRSGTLDSLIALSESDTLSVTNKIRVYNLLSGQYNTSSLDTALMYADKAYYLAKSNQDEVGMAKASFNKGIIYSNFYLYKESIIYYNLAYNYLIKTDQDELKTSVLVDLGIVYSMNNNLEKSSEKLNLALKISESNNDLYNRIRILYTHGKVYSSAADYSKAQIFLFDALNLNREYKDFYFQTVIVNEIGNVFFYIADYNHALKYYIHSLKLGEYIQDYMIINTAYTNMSIIYRSINKFDKAIENVNMSIKYYESTFDKQKESNAYNTLGLIYMDISKPDSALYFLNKSLDIKRSIADSIGFSLVYSNMAGIYVKKKNFDLAKKYLENAIRISSQYSDYYNHVIALLALSDLYNKTRNSNEFATLLQAKDIAENHKINASLIDVYDKLYSYYKSRNDFQNALHYHEQFVKLNDSLQGVDSRMKMEEIETSYEVDKKNNEIRSLIKEKEVREILFQKENERNLFEKYFILSLSLVIILVIIVVLLRYKQHQKNKLNALEKRNLKVETEMLRSQMNPHFIFNSLNSIQSFVSSNDTIDAERYLSNFAKLMRLILDNSRQSFITVENEINTLKLYLDLERLRFNGITYHIELVDIDEEFTLIPPMLSQPYIENAVLHGVSAVENGLINIEYKLSGNKIICTIDDNGIGRKKSLEINQSKHKKKSSLGIKVTQERIDLLKNEFDMDLTIEMIDKYDENSNPLGTKVILEMPYK